MTQSAPADLIATWLQRQLKADGWSWLSRRLDELEKEPSERTLQITLGMIPRKLGRDDFALTRDDLDQAIQVRAGWRPTGWSIDGAARILVLLKTAQGGDNTGFSERLETLCRTADLNESIALYRGLPLYPEPAKLDFVVGEGLRTSIGAIFEAIAHDNPFPREHFDEHRWNHMVLKALFVDSTLAPIQGLDERANPALARILCDYAHERWAAGRPVTFELWRCVGPFAEGEMLDDLKRALNEGGLSSKGAALALAANPDSAAADILASKPELRSATKDGNLTWLSLSLEAGTLKEPAAS